MPDFARSPGKIPQFSMQKNVEIIFFRNTLSKKNNPPVEFGMTIPYLKTLLMHATNLIKILSSKITGKSSIGKLFRSNKRLNHHLNDKNYIKLKMQPVEEAKNESSSDVASVVSSKVSMRSFKNLSVGSKESHKIVKRRSSFYNENQRQEVASVKRAASKFQQHQSPKGTPVEKKSSEEFKSYRKDRDDFKNVDAHSPQGSSDGSSEEGKEEEGPEKDSDEESFGSSGSDSDPDIQFDQEPA